MVVFGGGVVVAFEVGAGIAETFVFGAQIIFEDRSIRMMI